MTELYLQVQYEGEMTKRSSQGSETQLRIIAAAADLFHKQGVHATSPDDVIEASNTGKGQFITTSRTRKGSCTKCCRHTWRRSGTVQCPPEEAHRTDLVTHRVPPPRYPSLPCATGVHAPAYAGFVNMV